MVVTLEIPNAQTGDKKTVLNTSSLSARRKLERIIHRKLEEGAAVFVEFMGNSCRVKRYDSERDELVAFARKVAKGTHTFRINAKNAVVTVIAPMAGG